MIDLSWWFKQHYSSLFVRQAINSVFQHAWTSLSTTMFKLASSTMFKPVNRRKQAVRVYVCRPHSTLIPNPNPNPNPKHNSKPFVVYPSQTRPKLHAPGYPKIRRQWAIRYHICWNSALICIFFDLIENVIYRRWRTNTGIATRPSFNSQSWATCNYKINVKQIRGSP